MRRNLGRIANVVILQRQDSQASLRYIGHRLTKIFCTAVLSPSHLPQDDGLGNIHLSNFNIIAPLDVPSSCSSFLRTPTKIPANILQAATRYCKLQTGECHSFRFHSNVHQFCQLKDGVQPKGLLKAAPRRPRSEGSMTENNIRRH